MVKSFDAFTVPIQKKFEGNHDVKLNLDSVVTDVLFIGEDRHILSLSLIAICHHAIDGLRRRCCKQQKDSSNNNCLFQAVCLHNGSFRVPGGSDGGTSTEQRGLDGWATEGG